MTAALLKKRTQAFTKNLAFRFSCQNYRTTILNKNILIRTPLVATPIYSKNFVQKQEK